jgi:molybdate/tungstate transport system substrate-binding protein
MAELASEVQAASDVPVDTHGGPSVGLANGIRDGKLAADVFASADAQVIESVMMGEGSGSVRWQLIFCRQRMALVYSPNSRFRVDLEAAAAGSLPWYEAIQRPGFVLKRGDPRNDPGGYRGVLVLRLAELQTGIAGLADRIMQGADNEAQIAGGDFGPLLAGDVDAHITHSTSASRLGLPLVELPDEVSLGNPALAEWYRRVCYTNPHGQTFHGRPIAYGVTIPATARDRAGAVAFIRHLVSEAGQTTLGRHGFQGTPILVGGDAEAVPAELQAFVSGPYDEAG